MIRQFYALAWFILTGTIVVSIFSGQLDPVMLFAFSLIALGLVYALALWSVIVNTRDRSPGIGRP